MDANTLVELFADRFIATSVDGVCADLATGELVTMVCSAGDRADEDRRWLVRCDTLYRLRDEAPARLVDYGPLGDARRFEGGRTLEATATSSLAEDESTGRP
jgi:hypothetical protein